MIKVTIGTTMNRKDVIVPESTTLWAAVEQAGIIPATSDGFTLNGVPVRKSRGELDRTFEDYGLSGRAMLLAVKDSQNA